MLRNLRFLGLVLGLLAVVGVLAGGGAATEPPGTVVMSGLDNPRGLAFGPEGGLYVAEAGRGGSGPACATIRGELQCVGTSGAVSRLWKGAQERIATGLPSYAPAHGAGATGPHDISLHGRGGAYVVIGLGANPAFRAVFGQGFGRLVLLHPNGSSVHDDDIAPYEATHNPDQSPTAIRTASSRSPGAGSSAMQAATTCCGCTRTARSRPSRSSRRGRRGEPLTPCRPR